MSDNLNTHECVDLQAAAPHIVGIDHRDHLAGTDCDFYPIADEILITISIVTPVYQVQEWAVGGRSTRYAATIWRA